MIHKCCPCNYQTDNKANYDRHLLSNKHKNDGRKKHEDNKYICEGCERNFNDSGNLSRHKKICKGKPVTVEALQLQLNEKDKIINEMKYKFEHEKDKIIIENLKNQIQELKEDKKDYKGFVNGAGDIVKTSVSAMNVAMKRFKNAPALKEIDDYSIIHEDEDEPFEDILIRKHRKNKLDKYLAEKIILLYKKEDPEEQATWNTDISRSNYLIHEEIVNNDSKKDTDEDTDEDTDKDTNEDTNEDTDEDTDEEKEEKQVQLIWVRDQKGRLFKKRIVLPLLGYVRGKIKNKMDQITKQIKKNPKNITKLALKQGYIGEIINKIDDTTTKNNLPTRIIRITAADFYLNTKLLT